jgi:Tyrosine phosphatase family
MASGEAAGERVEEVVAEKAPAAPSPAISLPLLAPAAAFKDLHPRGPTETSNWVIPGHVIASARLALPDAASNARSLLRAGVRMFVDLRTDREREGEVPMADILARESPPEVAGVLRHVRAPIGDFGVTDDASTQRLVLEVRDFVRSGGSVVVSCAAGQGRTGLVCTLLVGVLYNLSPEEALAHNQRAFNSRRVRSSGSSPESALQFQQVRRLLTAEPKWW